MEPKRLERYTIRYPADSDGISIEMSQRGAALVVGTLCLALFGLSLVAPLRWPALNLGSWGFWPLPGFLLLMAALSVLAGRFIQRWTISREAITYSSSYRRKLRTLKRQDLASLTVRDDTDRRDPEGGNILPFEIDFHAKDGAEGVPPGFQFQRRRVFDEFLTILHEVLPTPIDDPNGLYSKIKKPNADALDALA